MSTSCQPFGSANGAGGQRQEATRIRRVGLILQLAPIRCQPTQDFVIVHGPKINRENLRSAMTGVTVGYFPDVRYSRTRSLLTRRPIPATASFRRQSCN